MFIRKDQENLLEPNNRKTRAWSRGRQVCGLFHVVPGSSVTQRLPRVGGAAQLDAKTCAAAQPKIELTQQTIDCLGCHFIPVQPPWRSLASLSTTATRSAPEA